MGRKRIVLLLVLTALILLSGVYVVGGTLAYSRYQQTSLATQEHCGGQAPVHICVRSPATIFSAFYPSYLAAQYPLISVDYSSSSPLTLVMRVSISHFSQQQTVTVAASTTQQSRGFVPPLQDQALQKLTGEEETVLQVQVIDTAGHLYYVDDQPLVLHSRWLMQWTMTNRLQIAAWVTPDVPAVTKLVEKATQHLREEAPPLPPGLVGYVSATPQQVIAQVDAIYDTLRLDYHIHYVQASVPYTASGASGDEVNEIVKLPAEVLQQRSGMCIELTTLLASAVEKIGLHAEIVVIPGHAFLGVATDRDMMHFSYWDAVDVNTNVAADSANVQADAIYAKNEQQHSIVDVITVNDARNAHVGPML